MSMSCQSDSDCGSGACCNGECVQQKCSTASDCGSPLTLPTGQTIEWTCNGCQCDIMPCTVNSDCASISPCLRCDGSSCVAQQCGSDSDCGDNCSCYNGYCLYNIPPLTVGEVDYRGFLVVFICIIISLVAIAVIYISHRVINKKI